METTTVPHEDKKRAQGSDHEEEYIDSDDDFEETFGAGRCWGFDLFCFKSRRAGTRNYGMIQQEDGGDDQYYNTSKGNWFVKRGKKLKEISELIAGPKWKTFIRKVGSYCNDNRKNNRKRMSTSYDAQSYALNFDDGNEEEVYDVHH
ncbi:hypothetical protein MKW98_014175 [Papaver atlanticum]|uniref:Stress induced protein n=1 Tax=Papaver atlanticum TaxID=357466 RepID=A0AAD4XFK0_9MAGN|nr:hypothetical protein MKW98_014175 [Papaver atlanticum]